LLALIQEIMVNIICDVCGATRSHNDKPALEWILGYDLETKSPHAVQRSLRFFDRWDTAHVLDLGAIHLCSVECKDKYVKRARAA